MDWRQAAGPCLARALAQTLWAGEGYYLQARARPASHFNEATGVTYQSAYSIAEQACFRGCYMVGCWKPKM